MLVIALKTLNIEFAQGKLEFYNTMAINILQILVTLHQQNVQKILKSGIASSFDIAILIDRISDALTLIV